MKNHNKTKVQLVNELVNLRKQIAEFEISESQRKKAEDLFKKVETESKQTYEALKASETLGNRSFQGYGVIQECFFRITEERLCTL